MFSERAVYYGWAIERVVEPAVLPWIDGRRSDRWVVERTVLLWIVGSAGGLRRMGDRVGDRTFGSIRESW